MIFRIVSYVATSILLQADLWILILVCNLVSDFLGPKYFSSVFRENQYNRKSYGREGRIWFSVESEIVTPNPIMGRVLQKVTGDLTLWLKLPQRDADYSFPCRPTACV